MRNKLTELTDRIDDHNIALAKIVAELQTLMHNRDLIIEDGASIGIKKTTMGKMLANVRVKYDGPGSAVETPLAEVLPEFGDPVRPATGGTISGETLIAMGYGDD